ncbi:MAG TPA: hypothetical protein VGD71_02300 [Kribbella sp.]|jgi:hypothetical protein
MSENVDDRFQDVRDSTTPILMWDGADIAAEIEKLWSLILYVLVARAALQCDTERPRPTCWPGVVSLADDHEVMAFAYSVAEEYGPWRTSKDRAPASRLGKGQSPSRASADNKVTPGESKAKARFHDQVRLAITCGALAGWRAFTSIEGLHHSLDILDGVARIRDGDRYSKFQRTRSNSLAEYERCAVLNLASDLTHSGMLDILNIAANYRLTWQMLKDSRDPRAALFLRQRKAIGLISDDRVIAQLTAHNDGQPSLVQQHWRARVSRR